MKNSTAKNYSCFPGSFSLIQNQMQMVGTFTGIFLKLAFSINGIKLLAWPFS